jgi:hypothetical protein
MALSRMMIRPFAAPMRARICNLAGLADLIARRQLASRTFSTRAATPCSNRGIAGISGTLSRISACAACTAKDTAGEARPCGRSLPSAQRVGLICRKAARRDSGDGCGMPKGSTVPAAGGLNSLLCPNRGQPMTHVRTMWRAFQDNLEVLECRRCNISVSQTASRNRKNSRGREPRTKPPRRPGLPSYPGTRSLPHRGTFSCVS